MLRALLADLELWGGVRVVTTLDSRLSCTRLPANRVVVLNPANHLPGLVDLAAECDAVYLIAPEGDGVLPRLSELVERTGVPLLGSSSAAVWAAADKWVCHCRCIEAGLPTPATWRVSPARAFDTAAGIGLPLVIKPQTGAGCEGVSLAGDSASLRHALADPALGGQPVLLQDYVAGTHASVSLLVTSQEALPLSLNRQRVSVGESFVYHGGQVPLQHPLAERALALARQAVRLFPGLRGYVGVDQVLTEDACYLIEINPRLTTSYVGLRRVININLARAIWQACRHDLLPTSVMLSGAVSFCKEGVNG